MEANPVQPIISNRQIKAFEAASSGESEDQKKWEDTLRENIKTYHRTFDQVAPLIDKKAKEVPQDQQGLNKNRIKYLDINKPDQSKLASFSKPYIAIVGVQRGGCIISYEVVIGYFRVSVKLLNLSGIESDSELKPIGTGSYGEVVVVDSPLGEFIAKRQTFYEETVISRTGESGVWRIKQNYRQINKVIVQHAFLRICSYLKIGPQVSKELGFDIVCYEDSAQMYMEECITDYHRMLSFDYEAFVRRIKYSVGILHRFKMIHKDIKPANILYSHNLKNFVLSDFGISHSIAQDIGSRTYTIKQGTPYYMSPQLKMIKFGTGGLVDLYHNDLYSLLKTLEQVRRLAASQFKMQSQSDNKQKYNYSEYSRMLLNCHSYYNQTQPRYSVKLGREFANLTKHFPQFEDKCYGISKRQYEIELLIRVFGMSKQLLDYLEDCKQPKIEMLRKSISDMKLIPIIEIDKLRILGQEARIQHILQRQLDQFKLNQVDKLEDIRIDRLREIHECILEIFDSKLNQSQLIGTIMLEQLTQTLNKINSELQLYQDHNIKDKVAVRRLIIRQYSSPTPIYLSIAKEVSGLHPQNRTWLLLRMQQYFLFKGRFDWIIELGFEDLNPIYISHIFYSYRQLNRHQLGINQLNLQLIKCTSKLEVAAVLICKCQLHLGISQIQQAKKCLKQVESQSDLAIWMQLQIAAAYAKLEDWRHSTHHLTIAEYQAISLYGEMHPRCSMVYCYLGDYHTKMGQYDKVEYYLCKSLKLIEGGKMEEKFLNVGEIYFRLGFCYSKRGRKLQGLQAMRKGIQISSNRQFDYFYCLGHFYLMMLHFQFCDYSQVVDIGKQVLSKAMKLLELHQDLRLRINSFIARALSKMKKYNQSYLMFIQILKYKNIQLLEPFVYKSTKLGLGLCYETGKQYRKAIKQFQEVVQYQGKSANHKQQIRNCKCSLSQLYEKLGDQKNALQYAISSLNIAMEIYKSDNNNGQFVYYLTNMMDRHKYFGREQEATALMYKLERELIRLGKEDDIKKMNVIKVKYFQSEETKYSTEQLQGIAKYLMDSGDTQAPVRILRKVLVNKHQLELDVLQQVYRNLGLALHHIQKYSEALVYLYRYYSQCNMNDNQVNYSIGICYKRQNKINKAEKYFNKGAVVKQPLGCTRYALKSIKALFKIWAAYPVKIIHLVSKLPPELAQLLLATSKIKQELQTNSITQIFLKSESNELKIVQQLKWLRRTSIGSIQQEQIESIMSDIKL